MRTLAFHAAAMAIAAVLYAGQSAEAAPLLSISGASDLPVPGNNDLVPTPNAAFRSLVPLGGIIDADASGLFWSQGAQVSTTAANVSLSFNYIGSLASATNTFMTPGGAFTTPGLDETDGGDAFARPAITVNQALPDVIDFGYATTVNGAIVANGGNDSAGGGTINFLAAYLEPQRGGGDVVWEITDTPSNAVLLLLDDGGAGPDLDYDDLGVVLVATPIPAALPLFVAALVSLGLMRWWGKPTRR